MWFGYAVGPMGMRKINLVVTELQNAVRLPVGSVLIMARRPTGPKAKPLTVLQLIVLARAHDRKGAAGAENLLFRL